MRNTFSIFLTIYVSLSTFSALAENPMHAETERKSRQENQDVVGRSGGLGREKVDGKWVYFLMMWERSSSGHEYFLSQKVPLIPKDAGVLESLKSVFAKEDDSWAPNIELNVTIKKNNDAFIVHSVEENRVKKGNNFLSERYPTGKYSVAVSGDEDSQELAAFHLFKQLNNRGFLIRNKFEIYPQKKAGQSRVYHTGAYIETELSLNELKRALSKLLLPDGVKLSVDYIGAPLK